MENDKRQKKNIKVFYNTINYEDSFSNRNSLFLFKKTERISAALYLISEMFPFDEPLRLSLRKGARDLIKDSLSLINKSLTERTKTLKDIKRKMFEISSYLSVANLIGLVTNMNSSVILGEMDNLIKVLDFEIKRHPSIDREINNDFFEENIKDIKRTKGQKDIKSENSVFYDQKVEEVKRTQIKSDIYNKDIVLYRDKNSLEEDGLNSKFTKRSFSKRKSDILDILKSDGKVSIKDISSRIIGCSEKTIQRDLIQLMFDGLVDKEGERRWSKYFLKN